MTVCLYTSLFPFSAQSWIHVVRQVSSQMLHLQHIMSLPHNSVEDIPVFWHSSLSWAGETSINSTEDTGDDSLLGNFSEGVLAIVSCLQQVNSLAVLPDVGPGKTIIFLLGPQACLCGWSYCECPPIHVQLFVAHIMRRKQARMNP